MGLYKEQNIIPMEAEEQRYTYVWCGFKIHYTTHNVIRTLIKKNMTDYTSLSHKKKTLLPKKLHER